MKKILHINYSRTGGAGRVAQLLSSMQNKLDGYESEFIYKIEGNLWKDPFQDIRSSIKSGLDNYVIKKNSFKPLFSLIREGFDKKIVESATQHQGVIHLHWITGILETESLLNESLISKPVVWTMHDMVPITGGCHYSLDCKKFIELCEGCPATKKPFRKKVSKNKIKKNLIFEKNKNLSIVVPSKWHAKKFENNEYINFSSLTVINNPVEDIFFNKIDRRRIKEKLKLPKDAFIVGFVSQNIDNPLKNFDFLLRMVEGVALRSERQVTILGIGESKKNYIKQASKVIITGAISQPIDLVEAYASVDVMVSTSMAETFGMSVTEAAALGIPSIVFSGTATEELVENQVTGFVVHNKDEFISRIIEIMESDDRYQKLGESARNLANSRYRINKIVSQYDEVYSKFES